MNFLECKKSLDEYMKSMIASYKEFKKRKKLSKAK